MLEGPALGEFLKSVVTVVFWVWLGGVGFLLLLGVLLHVISRGHAGCPPSCPCKRPGPGSGGRQRHHGPAARAVTRELDPAAARTRGRRAGQALATSGTSRALVKRRGKDQGGAPMA